MPLMARRQNMATFGRWWQGMTWHGVAGGQRRWSRRSSAAVGLMDLIWAWQAAEPDLDLIGPATASGR
jgi:hypothetical protein